jgi:cyclopropane-fatty-acyl-phospholipid synthase
VRFTSVAAELGVLLDPELKFGEAYMNGTFIVDEGSIADVIALALSQDGAGKVPHWSRPRRLWGRLQQFNRHGQTRKKVAHDYDLDGPFYPFFLDADRQLAAPISRRRTSRSKRPSLPRSDISRRSCW